MKRWLFVFCVYALYLALAKEAILLLQSTGIIGAQVVISDDAIIKWATIALFGIILILDIIHIIRYKKDFIVSAIGAYLFDSNE